MTAVAAPKHPGQRRVLSLDGGGIRGMLSLEVLTSTGAIVATW